MTGNILGIVTLTFLLENPQSKNKIHTIKEDWKRIGKYPLNLKYIYYMIWQINWSGMFLYGIFLLPWLAKCLKLWFDQTVCNKNGDQMPYYFWGWTFLT